MTSLTDQELEEMETATEEMFPEVAARFRVAHPDWIQVEKNGLIIGFATNEEEAQQMRDGQHE